MSTPFFSTSPASHQQKLPLQMYRPFFIPFERANLILQVLKL